MSTIGIMSPVFTAFSRIFLAGAILFLLAGTTAYGQAPTGTITGAVTDSSGAVMPGATVTIADKSTNTIRNLTANDSGLFSAPALAPGEYAVSAAMQGFRTTQRVAQVVSARFDGEARPPQHLLDGQPVSICGLPGARAQLRC